MNKTTAHKQGVVSGLEAGRLGDFTEAELSGADKFFVACGEICSNKRQYAGHPTYTFLNCHNSEALFEAFEAGETVGIGKAWQIRQRAALPEADRSAQPQRAEPTCKLRAGDR